ncbi:MAG: hypothetical protein AAF581_01910 [Planctomycetota bacterium]
MGSTTLFFLGLAAIALSTIGCATDPAARARAFMDAMDARPADERVANWDEIRAMMLREPPAVGDPAPDFALQTDDGAARIRLSDYRGNLPVVLIFGSWT